MNTATQATSSDVHATSCKTLVDTLVGLGSTWAEYGLKVGKMALATSAETLGKTAETLDTLAAAIHKRAEEIKAEEAKTGAPEKEEAPKADAPAADAASV